MRYLGIALGVLMYICYRIANNYGVSIVLFTLITKVLLFPINILTQKNSIQMVKLMPENNALKIRYIDDKDKLADEQLALYKRYHYNPFLSIVPLLIQIPLVLGLVYVINHPLSYVLNISDNDVRGLKEWVSTISDNDIEESTYQNEILSMIMAGNVPPADELAPAVESIKAFKVSFLGINLSWYPSLKGDYLLMVIPVLSGLSAWFMCYVQNRINVLQVAQSKATKNITTAFMIAFSAYFAFLVPVGVGLYWICGNLFSIPVMFLLNAVMSPRKYIDYDYLKKMEEQKKAKELQYKRHHLREKADYKRFMTTVGKDLVFYSESNGFYKYYEDILDYLRQHSSVVVHYVTSDPDDHLFTDCPDRIVPYYVASDRYLIPLFMRLECKICVMTVPDLEKYHIKRSRVCKDIEYIFTSHGMGSTALTFRKGALDWYDTIFCPGPDTFREIRDAEELYKTPRKRLVETGYPLIDRMIKEYSESTHKENVRPKIMIAPSWQPENIIDICVDPLLESLSSLDCDIILRPHPQQVRHEPEKFQILKERYKKFSNIEIQTDFSGTSMVFQSDVLITDWSDISWEYAFVTLQPVLFIDTPMKVMNPEYDKIKTVPINISLRSVIGQTINPDEISNAANAVKMILKQKEEYRETILRARNEHLYNVGKSKVLCAIYIIKSLQGSI